MKNRLARNPRPLFRIALLVFVVLAFSLAQFSPALGQTYVIQYDPDVAAMITQVKQATLYTYVAKLTGVKPVTVGGVAYTLRTRHTRSGTPIQKATRYTYEFLQGLGRLDAIYYNAWTVDGLSNRNVVGVLKGTSRASEIILLTAHIDDMPNGTVAPGADDNASGVAALMLAAKILSQYEFQRTIRFVVFTGEEQGELGSWAYARKSRNAGENIVAVINLDMLAWDSKNGPTMRVHTRIPSKGANDLEIANAFVGVVNAYTISLTPIITSYGMADSDHGSFWEFSYPAVCVIEDDGDLSSWGDFNPNYHTTGDKLSTLNMPYFTQMTAAIVGAVAHLAYP